MDFLLCVAAILLLTSLKVWASRRGYRGGNQPARLTIGLPTLREYLMRED